MPASNVLRAGRALIEDPNNWSQRAFARNAEDRICPIASDDACKFCAVGALARAVDSDMSDLYVGAEAEELLDRSVGECMMEFNDAATTTHAHVLAAYDIAIKLAEELENERT